MSNIFLLVLGTIIGITFGCLPGLTSTMSLAIFTPLTFGFQPESAFFFLIAIYAGSVFGGAISAILINIPGTPSAIATGIDGYPLALRGEGGSAISCAAISSSVGSLFGLVILMIFSPMIASLALKFGAWEYTILAIMGISMIAYVSQGAMLKGFIGGIFGLLLATVGQDPLLAIPRFSLGVPELTGGFNEIVILIGIYGIGEVLFETYKDQKTQVVTRKIQLKIMESFRRIKSLFTVIIRSSVIGTVIGAIPAAGGALGAIAAYSISKRYSKEPEKYGHGSYEGIASAEGANNASVGGALIPMMTLGIPGDPMTAVLIGALMIHGLVPGPMLFVDHPGTVSAIFIALAIASLTLLVFGLIGAPFFARVLSVPRHILVPMIVIFCLVGSFVMRNSFFDVGTAVFFGIVSFAFRKVDIQPHPIIIGFILGPMFEENFRRALMFGQGSFMPFLTRPLSLLLIAVTLVLFYAGIKETKKYTV
jgi:putative tricarboxylic transport membrane protein